ncbi:MAG: putative molybdenum carrier protein [Verrucomicrobiota bacterium]
MISEIRSGGQTGADRAAFDAAIAVGIRIGGWVPAGRWAEDGVISDSYPNLKETGSSDVSVRTQRNVEDSDGTLVVTMGRIGGGTQQTIEFAQSFEKPFLHLGPSDPDEVNLLLTWVRENKIQILNVAGPRASEEEEIYSRVFGIVFALLMKQREET